MADLRIELQSITMKNTDWTDRKVSDLLQAGRYVRVKRVKE
jgi:hypothetical protein